MQAYRADGFKAFGPATKDWMNAKVAFDTRLTNSKKEFNEKMRVFKSGLSSSDNYSTNFNSVRERGQMHHRRQRGHRGVREYRGHTRGTPY